MSAIFDVFSKYIGKKGALLIISMIPLIELRGSIPFGATVGLNWLSVFLLSIVGNMLPIPFIILFGTKLLEWLKTTKLFGKFFRRYEERLLRKSDKVQKYSYWGLLIFVGIPIPGTGAWSGALLSVLLEMKGRKSLLFIFFGVLLAGVIMTAISYGVAGAIKLF